MTSVGCYPTFLPRDQLRRRSESPCPTLEPTGELGSILHDIRQQLPEAEPDETIGQVFIVDIQRKSMGITIHDSAEPHNSTKSIDRLNRLRKQAERTCRNSSRSRHREARQRSKSRNSRLSVFCTHCRKIVHDVSDFWSIKRRENSRRFERNTGRSDLNRSPEGNQVNVADTRSREILSLEDSMIGEVHYIAQDAHTYGRKGPSWHPMQRNAYFSVMEPMGYSAIGYGTRRIGN